MKRLNSKWLRSSLHSLCGLCVLCVSVVICLSANRPQRYRGSTEKPLKEVFKNDFMIGAALNRRQFFEEDTRGAEVVSTHFNTITPENVLKWALVHPEPNRYDFTAADRFVEFGEKHG
ncbi:MAG TPA: endo-1,4-beta-xylanase, partial [Pyrinomonadaceae bacterium]|nr:endo-1,4-beta-xylanase [Pyrinomonadaceae bacterium]